MVTRFEPYMSGFPPEPKDYWYAFPVWILAVWGAAVWGSLAGTVLLLLRMKIAVPVLGVSLLFVIATMVAGFPQPAPEGASDPAFAVVIAGIAALFFGYASFPSRKNLLG